MNPWPQRLAAPVFALDNFRMAQELSAKTVNRAPAKPIHGGGVLGVNVVRREAANIEARCPASTHPQRMDARPLLARNT